MEKTESKTEKAGFYGSLVTGAAFLMLLRVFDKASALSVILVILGLTALLYSVRHASFWWEYVLTGAAVSLTFAVRFYGYTGSALTDLLLGPAVGLIMFFLMAAERILKKFENNFWYTLIYPLLYFAFMYFTEVVKINMPFRLDSYFSCIPVLCQITSLLGVYFLDFLLAWTGSVLVYAFDHRKGKRWILPVSLYGATLLFVFGFGIWHLNRMNKEEREKTDTVRVACVTGPYCGDFVEALNASFTIEETLASFTKAVEGAEEENAEILMFSEEAYSVRDKDEDTLLEKARELASEKEMHILLAYEVTDTDDSESGKSINKLSWISDEGEILYDYTKHCIIPFIETADYVRGEKNIEAFQIQVHGKSLQVATAICYDSDFDLFMSHMGKDTDLLFLPTWDWNVIAEEHFGVARLRAVSSETTVIRSVYDGWNAVIGSSGNVLEWDNTNDTGYETILVYDVPV